MTGYPQPPPVLKRSMYAPHGAQLRPQYDQEDEWNEFLEKTDTSKVHDFGRYWWTYGRDKDDDGQLREAVFLEVPLRKDVEARQIRAHLSMRQLKLVVHGDTILEEDVIRDFEDHKWLDVGESYWEIEVKEVKKVRRKVLRYVLYVMTECPKYITKWLFESEKKDRPTCRCGGGGSVPSAMPPGRLASAGEINERKELQHHCSGETAVLRICWRTACRCIRICFHRQRVREHEAMERAQTRQDQKMKVGSFCIPLGRCHAERRPSVRRCALGWPSLTCSCMLRSAALSTAQDEEEDNIDDRLRLIAKMKEPEPYRDADIWFSETEEEEERWCDGCGSSRVVVMKKHSDVLKSLKDTPFQWGPWGETLSQYKFLFVGSVVNMTPSPEGMHGAFDEPTITVDWGLKLSEEAHANLFKRIRNHFEQATAIVDDVKEKRKYRLSEDDLLLIRNLMALWDQIKTFCQARMSNFNDFNDALVNTNHKDGDLREILDQRPIHYAMSMMPSAREAALKEVKALEESATMEVEKQRQEVRQARWKFFQTALEKDQKTLLQLAGAPAKLEVMRHRKVMAWRLDQAKKGEKIVQSYMAKYLTTEFVEKVEHAQQKEVGLPTGLLKQKEIDEKRARKQRLRARKEEAKKRMEAQREAKEPADRSEEVPEDYKQEEKTKIYTREEFHEVLTKALKKGEIKWEDY
eukprot:g29082.t1